jgi:hypothetical protein
LRILFLILILQIFTYLSTEETVIFSEIDGKFTHQQESEETSESTFILSNRTYFDKPDLTFAFSNKIRQYIDNYDVTDFETSLSFEKRWEVLVNYTFLDYQKNSLDTLDFVKVGNSLSSSSGSDNFTLQYSLDLYWLELLNSFDYNLFTGSFSLFKQNYYRSSSLHQKIIFNLNQVKLREDTSNLLFNLNYDLKFTLPVSEVSGLTANLELNYNLNKVEEIFFPGEEFYNELCYQEQRFTLKFKTFQRMFMFNPHISISRRKYLEVAVEDEFTEVGLNTGLHSDCVLKNNLLIYIDLAYSSIRDDLDRVDLYSLETGMRYQFDIYVR